MSNDGVSSGPATPDQPILGLSIKTEEHLNAKAEAIDGDRHDEFGSRNDNQVREVFEVLKVKPLYDNTGFLAR
ncbi:hypothetical protein HO173_005923 [Letharia columbiana]|uniref:Uncharacterized protein n=1 Tax=Letharia columbiana TaxID=112416 RepID=A0A8H6L501_9LECA|nr:uncharacterized protein HO173_005923 [Letharia columbiana]KAF6235728.1 hypothetical protein HO173_005923 [Letharia columbiana]